jgi:hypothetical protein
MKHRPILQSSGFLVDEDPVDKETPSDLQEEDFNFLIIFFVFLLLLRERINSCLSFVTNLATLFKSNKDGATFFERGL